MRHLQLCTCVLLMSGVLTACTTPSEPNLGVGEQPGYTAKDELAPPDDTPNVPGTKAAGDEFEQSPGTTAPARGNALAGPTQVETNFESAPGVKLTGKAELKKEASGVSVRVDVEFPDAASSSVAVHIHERADCSDIRGESMGSHFEPRGHKHGLPSAKEHHLGDLGNMKVDADGKGSLRFTITDATLEPGNEYSLLGRAVVIHEGLDKGTGKAGDAGSPVGCAALPQG